jgi:hypothetical protein
MRELRASLAGPRSARARLVEELEAHLEDAVERDGEAEALARMGSIADIAGGWNELQRRKRRRTRRSLALVSVSLGCAVALGVTQYAAGGRSHHMRKPAQAGAPKAAVSCGLAANRWPETRATRPRTRAPNLAR